jgi:hypothetical protein
MSDPTDYENLFGKRRVRDVNATGSLIPKKMSTSESLMSLFPFNDSIPSPAEFQAILDRTTPLVLDTDINATVVPMEIEENVAIE